MKASGHWRRGCRGRAWLAGVLLPGVLLLPGAPAGAQAVPLPGQDQWILVNTVGGLPGRWVACAPEPCPQVRAPDAAGSFALVRPAAGGSGFGWVVPGDAQATRVLENLQYDAELWRSPEATALILRSREPFGRVHLVHRSLVPRAGHTLKASLQIPPGARLALRGGADLAGPAMPGLGGIYARARAVSLGPEGQVILAPEGRGNLAPEGRGSLAPEGQATPAGEPRSVPVAAGTWVGVRGRFWALLARPDVPLRAQVAAPASDEPAVALGRPGLNGSTVEFTFYGGPVAAPALRAVAPELTGMLYASLWGWLRALAFALSWLLARWQELVGNAGLAIILLSLTVKLLMSPLTWLAERWQAEVNRTQSLLAPELAAIRRQWRGEEAHRRTLAVYAQHGVKPWYTLKSLAGFLIQIPVFIAAFDMLGENFGLRHAGFLWITDLSVPDRAWQLTMALPFFGGYLNLLPLVMTGLTVLAARLQEDPSLAPDLRRGQRWRLYGLAGLFFVLLYTFPAGMVLYWTANNLWHLLRILVARSLATRAATPEGA